MTPEQEERLEFIRTRGPAAVSVMAHEIRDELLAMVDELRKELEHRHGESPWACCVDMEHERDSLRTQVEGLREAARRAMFALGAHAPCEHNSCRSCKDAFDSVRAVLASSKTEET